MGLSGHELGSGLRRNSCGEKPVRSQKRQALANGATAKTPVNFDETSFVVKLSDGRELRVPLSWFPTLHSASPEQRTKIRISRSGEGLHWDELDEDISVEGLFRGQGDLSTRKSRPA
jgi:hypothetical protein